MTTARHIVVWARVLLPFYLAVVGWIVFSPSDDEDARPGWVSSVFELIDEMRAAFSPAYVALEFTANVAMFVPFGMLVWLALARPRWWIVMLLGFATTVTIELVQRALPSRYSTLSDVIANTLGAAIGLLLVRALADRAVRRRE